MQTAVFQDITANLSLSTRFLLKCIYLIHSILHFNYPPQGTEEKKVTMALFVPYPQ